MATKITMDSKESQIYVFKAKSNTSLNVANTYKIDSTSKIPFSKYNIKETDMRVKTATFTSPIYVDLTQNKWFVRIASPYHENFGGIILSVEKDEDSGMYDYQCQDYSRNYQSKDKLINTTCSYYEVLQKLIVGSMQSGPLSRTQKQTYSYTLSGLQPISKYRQKVLPNLSYQNPLKKVNKFVMEGSAIEKIRNICYQEGSAIDVYFDQNGIIKVVPYNYQNWLQPKIIISDNSLASRNIKMDTTNIITGVRVYNSEKKKYEASYNSKELIGFDLASIYGNLRTSIDVGNEASESSHTSDGTVINNLGLRGTGKTFSKGKKIYINTDLGYGKSKDKQWVSQVVAELKKLGYKNVYAGGVGPNRANAEVVGKNAHKNSVVVCACSGISLDTYVTATGKWYQNGMKKNNVRPIYAFRTNKNGGAVTRDLDNDNWSLGKAHDDKISGSKKSPGKSFINAGIDYVYCDSPKALAHNIDAFCSKGFSAGYKYRAGTKSLKTTTSTSSNSILTNLDKAKRQARSEITDSVRDLLTFKVKFAGGQKVFKYLHTNMFIYTILPEDFKLVNFKKITTAMNGPETRYSGYQVNRWYVEGVTINNDSSGMTFEIELNPFASSYSSYGQALQSAIDAYKSDSTPSQDDSESENVGEGDVYDIKKSKSYIDTYGIPNKVVKLAKAIYKRAGKPKTKEKTMKAVHDYVEDEYGYSWYANSKYRSGKSVKTTIVNASKLNCCDHANLNVALGRALGIKMRYRHSSRCYFKGHGWAGHVWCEFLSDDGKYYAIDTSTSGSKTWKNHGGSSCATAKKLDSLSF